HPRLVAPPFGPAPGLRSDGKRCQDQRSVIRRLDRLLAPLELHFRLAEPGVEKAAGRTHPQMMLDAMRLEREQVIGKRRYGRQPARCRPDGLARKKLAVVLCDRARHAASRSGSAFPRPSAIAVMRRNSSSGRTTSGLRLSAFTTSAHASVSQE